MRCILFFVCVFLWQAGLARQSAPPYSDQHSVGVPTAWYLEPIDAHQLRSSKVMQQLPLRVASIETMVLDIGADTGWIEVNGGRLWRTQFISEGATDLNFGFRRFRLPQGATVHVIGHDDRLPGYFQGAFTAADNPSGGQYWTPMVPGDRATIEVFVPDTASTALQLELGWAGRGFRDAFQLEGGAGLLAKGIQACNVDVVCPAGNGFRDQIRSVVQLSFNTNDGFQAVCTGSLIMDAAQSFTPYVLTAAHCGPFNEASLVGYFNYQSATCGALGGGNLNQSVSGSTILVRTSPDAVDSMLLQLASAPPTSFDVYYSGWDRSGEVPNGSTIGIHHPGGFEKMISVNDDPIVSASNCTSGSTAQTHWDVVWDQGTTQGGSSGSALFNGNTGRIIGFLTGGGASCSTPQLSDCYGKFSTAWNNQPNNQNLATFLDPQGSGVLRVDGSNPGVTGGGGMLCASPNAAIPDNAASGVSSTINVTDTGTLSDLDVTIATNHTFVSDLTYTLTHLATGTAVTLIDRPGIPASANGCGADNINVTLDDEASAAVENQCATSGTAISGRFSPNQALAAFDGESLSGNWRLTVVDSAAQDTGTLTQWCLEPTTSAQGGSRSIAGSTSGTYIVDGLSDQGFFVTVDARADGSLFLFFAWFTFDNDGFPLWIVGVENVASGSSTVTMSVQTFQGPRFLDFSNVPASGIAIGTMTFTQRNCQVIDVDYDFGQNGVGTMELNRLTSIAGEACQ